MTHYPSRRLELDALRGLLLLLMAITHLPTRLSVYGSQPVGFVSAAEGFVFLSAFIAGAQYAPRLRQHGAAHVRSRLWGRALKLYGYHLGLLLVAFTIAASFAAISGRPALRNMLAFYFDSPTLAIVSGSLLLYQPPLLDILPLYIVFLALTPWLLEATRRSGWRPLLLLSGLLWLLAQLDGRRLLHELLCALSGLSLPAGVSGAFDLLAWQLLWIVGLWAGVQYQASPLRFEPLRASWLSMSAAALATLFLIWRHRIGGFAIDLGNAFALLDKWHLGALRLLNFAALSLVVIQMLLPLLGWLRMSVLGLLGRASLQAFTAHLLIVMFALGLIVDEETPLSLGEEVFVVTAAVAAMLVVARVVQKPRVIAALDPQL